MATRAPRRGTRAGNPLGEADGPPRARAEEKGGRGRRRAPAPYLPRPRTRARAHGPPGRDIGACDGARPSRAFPSHLRGPRPASRSPRRARIGSRGTPRRPAGRRRSGRPRVAEGGGEGSGDGRAGDAGSEPRRSPLRGARPRREPGQTSRARAARRRSQTERAAGRVAGRRNGIEGEGTPASRESPGTKALPREGGRPRPLPNDTRSQPRDGRPRARPSGPPPLAPLLSPDLRAPGGGGVDEGGGRGRGGRGGRGPLAAETRPQTHTGVPSPRGSQPTGPRGHDPRPDASHPPTPRRPDLTESSPPGTARGTEEARGRGGGSADQGGPRAGTEEQGGKRRTRGKGGGRASEGRARGRDRRATATDDDARTRLNLGRRRARAGPCEQTPSRATPPSLAGRGGRRLIVKRRSDRRSPGRNPGPQVRSKCR